MYKNITPSLISFDTKLNKLRGFYFSDNFNFYKKIITKNKFHYTLALKNDIEIPNIYDFRNGYFFKKGRRWYYERKLGIFTLKFCFDPKDKIFYFNRLYSLIPFEIGHIFPAGRHVADLMNLELFLNGFIIFGGCAFRYKNKNICIIAPSFNGKTNFMKHILHKGGQYISEDILILEPKNNKVFPTSARSHILSRTIDKELVKDLNIKNIAKEKNKIDRLFLIQNSTNKEHNNITKNFFDYLYFNSLTFYRNPFIRAYIFRENLLENFLNRLDRLKNPPVNYQFKQIKNFNFDDLLED